MYGDHNLPDALDIRSPLTMQVGGQEVLLSKNERLQEGGSRRLLLEGNAAFTRRQIYDQSDRARV